MTNYKLYYLYTLEELKKMYGKLLVNHGNCLELKESEEPMVEH